MNMYMYICSLLILTSCRHQENISVEYIISDEIVTITRGPNNKNLDSVCLNIPLEFKLNIHPDVKYLSIDNIINNHYLSIPSDVVIYSKQNKKPIFDFKKYLTIKKPFNIIIRERNHLISIDDAKKLLKYKKESIFLHNLKFGDTIKIEPYDQFRKNNPFFFNKLKKIGDTLIFNTRKNDEKIYKSKKIKINW